MKNPYEVLGVARTASDDDIRKAYRKLAKTLHPDLNPGNSKAEERFKELSAAYALVSDPEQRKRFDNGEIDGSGAERSRQSYYKNHAGRSGARSYESTAGFADFAGAEDIFADMFGRQARQSRPLKGQDVSYTLTVDFLDAINGGKKRISLPDGGSLDLTLPAGIEDGKVLRLRGKGMAVPPPGQPGDALVTITVKPHRLFVRKGNDIHIELPVTIREAVLGARLKVPTPSGDVMLTVPKGSNTGSVLRLRGKGVPTGSGSGDELVTLRVVLPNKPDAALEGFLYTWQPEADDDPRGEMMP